MTVSLALRVDAADPTPPYEQLRRQLADLIETGGLPEGTRLPPVRQLAADLGLATGTVARSYRELENLQLVVARRGGGTTVTGTPHALPEKSRQRRLEGLLIEAVQRARQWGATDEQITSLVNRALQTKSH